MARTSTSGKTAYRKAADTQSRTIDTYTGLGCMVYVLSQPRAHLQTPGLPDLWVVHEALRSAWWHECKAEGGRLTPAQREFKRLAAVGRQHVVVGGAEAAARFVAELMQTR